MQQNRPPYGYPTTSGGAQQRPPTSYGMPNGEQTETPVAGQRIPLPAQGNYPPPAQGNYPQPGNVPPQVNGHHASQMSGGYHQKPGVMPSVVPAPPQIAHPPLQNNVGAAPFTGGYPPRPYTLVAPAAQIQTAPVGTYPPSNPMARPGTLSRLSHPSTSQHPMDQLTGQMSNLATGPTIATQPIGIIGQPLPLADLRKSPKSPIQPQIDPAYFRTTLGKIPKTAATLHKTRLPFGITITPYPAKFQSSDHQVPVIDGPIVRCRRCRTYLNPFVEMIDQGAKWRCNLCFMDNEFPANYDYDPVTQRYLERSTKAELHHPVYEFVAPMEYMVRPPQPPVYLFLLDVSYHAINSGVLSSAARIISDSLDSLPNAHDRTKVAIMTVDSTIHFYNLSPKAEDPRMLVVSDLEDPFLPCVEDLLVSLTESRPQIEKLLSKLGSLFNSTQTTTSALGSALSAAVKLLGPMGGKIVIVQAALPNIGDGKVINRENNTVLGTSRENSLLQPANNFYKTLATECSRVQVCIDMFLFPMPFLDIATIGCASKFTGGKVFLYPDFVSSSMECVEKFAGELSTHLKEDIGLEAVIRIRASQGVSLNAYHGSFFLRSTDLLAVPNVNPRHSYSAQVVIDENLNNPLLCFQTAVLHTNCQGERRIRVINSAYPVTDDPKEVLLNADVGAITDVLFKMAVEKSLANRLEDARDALQNKLNDILLAIKNVFQTGQNPQLLLTENLRLLPLLLLSILKSPAVRGGKFTLLDYRSYMMILAKTLSTEQSLILIYPYMFGVHTMPNECGYPDQDTGEIVLPPPLDLGSECLERHGLYVLFNGLDFYIWIGSQLHPELCQLIFGQPASAIKVGKMTLPTLDNPWSKRLATIMFTLTRKYSGTPSVTVIREDGEEQQQHIKSAFLVQLIQDKIPDGQPSYSAWAGGLRDKIYSVR